MESLTASNNANFLLKNSLALDFQWKYPWLGQLPTKNDASISWKIANTKKTEIQNSNTRSKWKNTQQIWWFTRKIEKMFLIHFQITRKLQSHIIDSKWQKENDEMWFLFGDYFLIYRVDVNGWLCRTMVSQRAILFRFFFFLCSHSISFWSLLPLFRSLSSLYYCSLEMKLRRKCVLYALNHPNIGIDRE